MHMFMGVWGILYVYMCYRVCVSVGYCACICFCMCARWCICIFITACMCGGCIMRAYGLLCMLGVLYVYMCLPCVCVCGGDHAYMGYRVCVCVRLGTCVGASACKGVSGEGGGYMHGEV